MPYKVRLIKPFKFGDERIAMAQDTEIPISPTQGMTIQIFITDFNVHNIVVSKTMTGDYVLLFDEITICPSNNKKTILGTYFDCGWKEYP